ncbi:MAG: SDR family oxidoreductase [Herpetosiphon sp.]
MRALKDQVALVAGATRGAGRGIACMLGEAGATVYCTGRSIRGHSATADRPESIDETAELVSQYGGTGIAVQVDHSVPRQVEQLCEQIERQQGGLDLLVNDIWGGDPLTEWGKPYWEHSLANGLLMQQRAVHTHLITSYYATPLLLRRGRGLIVEMTDGATHSYRENLYYDLAKVSTIRLAYAMAHDLAPYGVTAVALTPGFLRSEAVLDRFGVSEATWRDAISQDSHFAASETPFYVGRAVVALASDTQIAAKQGMVLSSWQLAREYGFTDVDGSQPDWGSHFEQFIARHDGG